MPISSQVAGPLGAIYQQGIDPHGIQREVSLSRTTDGQDAKGKYRFTWSLTIYMHPGIRRVLPVVSKTLLREPPAPVMKLAMRLDKLSKYERDWFIFHNFALHSESLKGVLYMLKRFGA